VFVTLERQNKLQVYQREPDGSLSSAPLFTKDTLTAPDHIRPGQAVGTVHMHPDGRFVYVANRASGTTDFESKPVFVGGENSIAVFRVNQDTGEPTLVQNANTRGMHPRTFALDAGGRILIAANQMSLAVRRGNRVTPGPRSRAVSGSVRMARSTSRAATTSSLSRQKPVLDGAHLASRTNTFNAETAEAAEKFWMCYRQHEKHETAAPKPASCFRVFVAAFFRELTARRADLVRSADRRR
jgi:hypothetical protein